MTDIENDMIVLMAADAVASATAKRKQAVDAETKAKKHMKEVFETTGRKEATASDGSVVSLKTVNGRNLRTVNGGKPSKTNPYIIDIELTKEQVEAFYSFKPIEKLFVAFPKK